MDGQAYFDQEVLNGNIPNALVALANAQEQDNDDTMFEIFQTIIIKAFEDGANHESDVQYNDGNALHR
jgi:hypothetical protein